MKVSEDTFQQINGLGGCMFRKIFYQGRFCDEESSDVAGLARELKSRTGYLHGLKVDDVIEFFDEVGKQWSKNPELKKLGLGHLIDFMSKDNLTVMLDTALRDRHGLDGFVKLNEGKMITMRSRGDLQCTGLPETFLSWGCSPSSKACSRKMRAL
jgi:hypothetical protein